MNRHRTLIFYEKLTNGICIYVDEFIYSYYEIKSLILLLLCHPGQGAVYVVMMSDPAYKYQYKAVLQRAAFLFHKN